MSTLYYKGPYLPESVQELIVKEGLTRLISDLRPRWVGLKRLDLSGSGLAAVPPESIDLPHIQILNLDNNKLTALPSRVGAATHSSPRHPTRFVTPCIELDGILRHGEQ